MRRRERRGAPRRRRCGSPAGRSRGRRKRGSRGGRRRRRRRRMPSRNSRRIQGQAGALLLPSATEVKGQSQLKMRKCEKDFFWGERETETRTQF